MLRRDTRWAVLLAVGAYLSVLGGCLPEDYLALSARGIAVDLANSLVGIAVAPVFDLVGPGSGAVQP
ncbi:MAG: hypothetical protein ACE5E5_05375 [Phycisphaerae bacterium]